MQLFFQKNITSNQLQIDGENFRHIIQVLRSKVGDNFLLTNGAGALYTATISQIDKKYFIANLESNTNILSPSIEINIAIAFTKNINRMEWLLEKITEIGVTNIYPLQTKRAEQLFPKEERLNHILISAICQSKKYYLPKLHPIITLEKLFASDISEQKFIAHCIDDEKKNDLLLNAQKNKSSLILIGPEGDFTLDEVNLCLQNNCMPVSLGKYRLRTETAGLVGITILNQINNE